MKNIQLKLLLNAIEIQNKQKSEMKERRCVKNGIIYGFRQKNEKVCKIRKPETIREVPGQPMI